MDTLAALENWYASNCNGDWEHTYGIEVTNIDNPGWSLRVELIGTHLQNSKFQKLNIQRDHDHDWILCKVENGVFRGYGGPGNLGELINVFIDWSASITREPS